MANEARIQSSLQVRKTSGSITVLDYRSQPSSYQATVTGTKGPVPGAINVPVTGVSVNFAELTQPGLCRFMNLDATNFVTIGIYDGAAVFPVLELLPGEIQVVRLSRYLQEEFAGTGTGTPSDVDQLWLFADTAACNVLVEAFET